MADPAAHSARADAERSGTVVGSDVDRIESALLADIALEGEDFHPPGYWVVWEKGGPA